MYLPSLSLLSLSLSLLFNLYLSIPNSCIKENAEFSFPKPLKKKLDNIKSRLGFIEKRDVVDLNRLTTFRGKKKKREKATRIQRAFTSKSRSAQSRSLSREEDARERDREKKKR